MTDIEMKKAIIEFTIVKLNEVKEVMQDGVSNLEDGNSIEAEIIFNVAALIMPTLDDIIVIGKEIGCYDKKLLEQELGNAEFSGIRDIRDVFARIGGETE